jgi:hypothetical protein
MLSVEEVRAVITTSLSDSDLTDVIAREEAWLERRIGPLEGERVETFLTTDGDEALRLTRAASSVSVEDDSGLVTDVALRGWSNVIRTAGSWSGDALVTYEPDDGEEVRRALLTLVRLTLGESAYASQSSGGYSYSVALADQRQMRFQAWRTLLRPRQPMMTRLRSAIPSGGRTVTAVAVEAVGS